MLDLSQLDTSKSADAGVAVEILHPVTRVPLGVRILVFGTDSEIYRSHLRRRQNRTMERAKRGRGQAVTAEELENESTDLLVACTKGWEADVVEGDGEEKTVTTVAAIPFGAEGLLPCTPENVRRIYAHPGFRWLREQVDAEIGDRANFLAR